MAKLIFNSYQRHVQVSGDHNVLVALQVYLNVEVANAFFRRKYAPGWNGKVNFYNNQSNIFSRGLLPHVVRWAKKNSLEYQFKSNYLPLPPGIAYDDSLIGAELRDDQKESIQAWLANGGVGTIMAATGSGKTLVSTAIIKSLLQRKIIKRALFVVPGLSVMKQTESEFKKHGLACGILGDDIIDINHAVVVAGIQALYLKANKTHKDNTAIKKLLSEVNLVVFDECHHSKTKQIKTIIGHTRTAKYVLGLSGSPFQKYDPDDLQQMTAEDVSVLSSVGPIVSVTKASALIEDGNLAKPLIYLYPIYCLCPIYCDEGSLRWQQSQQTFLYDNPDVHSNVVQAVKQSALSGCSSLVIAGSRIGYAKLLDKIIQDSGVTSVCLTGATSADDREDVRQQVNQKLASAVQNIVTTTIFDESADLPNLHLVVIASGGLSTIKTIQRVGRGLRKKSKGKNVVVIVDFIFYDNKYLAKHSLARLRQYISEPSYEIKLIGQESDHSSTVRALLKDRVSYSPTLPQTSLYRSII